MGFFQFPARDENRGFLDISPVEFAFSMKNRVLFVYFISSSIHNGSAQ